MKKFNKIISGALAALMIFTSVPIYATNDFSSEITSEITSEETSTESSSSEITTENDSKTSSEITNNNINELSETEKNSNVNSSEETSDISTIETPESSESSTKPSKETTVYSDDILNILETDENNEENTDSLYGWNIDLKVYDNDINNGNTPLNTIDWNLNPPTDENGANYNYTYTKEIKMLINYDNDNATKTYEPGEITILIPALLPYSYNSTIGINSIVSTVANDDTHIGFPWTFTGYTSDFKSSTTSISKYCIYYVFTNADRLEANTNFEGSIEISYRLISLNESDPEVDYDEHIKEFTKNLKVRLMSSADFEKIKTNYDDYVEIVSDQIGQNLKEELDYENKLISFDNKVEEYLKENNIGLFISPGYPDWFPTLSEETKYYSFENTDSITFYFDEESKTDSHVKIEVFDKNTDTLLGTIGGKLYNAKKTYNTNSIKTIFTYENINTQRFFSIVSGDPNLSTNKINSYFADIKKIIQDKEDFIDSYENELDARCKNITIDDIFNVSDVNSLETNQFHFNYTRHYYHPWVKEDYTIKQEALPISVPDILPSGWENYTWVDYKFYDDLEYPIPYRYKAYPKLLVPHAWGTIRTSFSEGVKVISSNGNEIKPDSNGQYILTYDETHRVGDTNRNRREVFVGYPKSIYNEENNNTYITNEIELWGPYKSKINDPEYLAEHTISLNLADFEFKYSGDIIGIEKKSSASNSNNRYYQNIALQKGPASSFVFDIVPDFNYYGEPTTLKIGDDILFSSDLNGDYSRVNDDDYYFSRISFPWLVNKANNQIASKYSCELWVRRAGQSEYEKYSSFTNRAKIFMFGEEDEIVGFYFLIKDMKEGIANVYASGIGVTVSLNREDIPTSGRLYNFGYVQLYTKDDNNQLVWQNKVSLDNYDTLMTQLKIADYDKETYGDYVQRSVAYLNWKYYNLSKPTAYLQISKGVTNDKQIIQDETNQQFLGTYTLSVNAKGNTEYLEDYIKDYDKNYLISGYKLYDLLPKGVNLTSTEEEILESINTNTITGAICFVDENGNKFYKNEMCDMIKKNASVKIVENWNNTGRTLITINMPFDKPLFCFYYGDRLPANIWSIIIKFDFSIPYDSYLEYGATFKNIVYGEWISDKYTFKQGILDNGIYDNDAIDINGNGSKSDYLVYSTSTTTLSRDIATHQDVQTSGASTINNFDTGTIYAEYGKEYTYKLRVRTAQNKITNLIIYNNLEKWIKNKDGNFIESHDQKKYWQGDFVGIDTSYAESKGYNVKVWYSENEKAGTLAEDPSWKEYSDSVDKTNVKSLAFQYLDSKGNPAVIPEGSMTYVLVKMRAPANEDIKTFAYNGCWTQWNALNTSNQIVPEITGINSNIVKVALPNSIIENEIPSIQLNIEKEIQGTQEAFENMQLDPNGEYQFMISLVKQEENEDGSHDVINGVVSNKKGIVIKDLSYGTWLITESDDTYFDLLEIISLDDPEIMTPGVTFEKTDAGYMLTINEDIDSATEYSLKVINEIEPERFYENKDSEVNIFKGTPLIEEQSLLDKLINFFE